MAAVGLICVGAVLLLNDIMLLGVAPSLAGIDTSPESPAVRWGGSSAATSDVNQSPRRKEILKNPWCRAHQISFFHLQLRGDRRA
jgi:hypothetical protein